MTPVPDGVVRQFYHHASQCNQGEEAEILYAFSRAPNTMNSHMYPPPHGTALVWLMEHLATKSRRTHLSRTLAAEVAENHLPIPLHSRARFLSLTAARGYGTLARVLWERYSTGKDKITVVGNSALMIRMVSLFNHLAQKMAPRKRDRTGNAGPRQHDSEDFVDFTNHILSEYRHCHQPLSNAHHRVLTSLARAYFILGESAEGFNTFKILMERKEIPDIYDVNVALTAMAEHHPRSAARMIQRMIEKGLRPDAVTFGTVMHHALLHNDMDLVADMIARARELKDVRMNLKSVAALVRASVAPNDDNFRANQRAKLEGAMSIVKSLMKPHSISSPQTGKYLVFASLRADEPVMAYRFWKLMVKDSTEWNDREQQFQRRLIAQMIRKHHKRCRLDNNQTLAMLSQLNRAPGIK
ncbi:hypothetical protein BD779DRAFT_1434491 [Infundibulicybe gibba]|nr:hypothetical protein BD779DRAFT_1434491 [Infundibulicybe gibba]